MPDFAMFDADQHYYEATDAFTRHLDPRWTARTMQWAEVRGKQRLLVGGRINRFIPNPTFDPIATPGALTDYFRAKDGVTDMRSAMGTLESIADRPEYRDRDARLAVLDAQGVEACFMLPTLGVGMEAALETDPEAFMAAFTAFNRWLDDDWGYNYRDRIHAIPYVSLIDVDWAVAELEHALAHGARAILMRPSSVYGPTGRRTPGNPAHDAFWARVNEAGISVLVHGGDASYGAYQQFWGLGGETEAFKVSPLMRLLSASPVHDFVASIMADRLFERFPNLRLATVETGSYWVGPLLKKLRTVAIQAPGDFGADPYELFLEHVWVSPFFEDDVLALVDLIGPERTVFGSDWPHVEGLEDPATFVKELEGLGDTAVEQIMRTNAFGLITPRTRP